MATRTRGASRIKAAARKTTRTRTATRSQARTTTRSPRSGGGQGKTTIDHAEIRQWVEERGGYPATVVGTERDAEQAGVLRIDYPGYSGLETLQRISWDEFFEKFDQEKLAFLHQDKTKDGHPSRFSKLIDRKRARSRAR